MFGQSIPCLKEECDDLPKRIMNVTTNKKLFCMPSKPYNTPSKLQKTCVDSVKSLGITLRMGTKVMTRVSTRNLITTVTATAASNKNKREIKYGKSNWIKQLCSK